MLNSVTILLAHCCLRGREGAGVKRGAQYAECYFTQSDLMFLPHPHPTLYCHPSLWGERRLLYTGIVGSNRVEEGLCDAFVVRLG